MKNSIILLVSLIFCMFSCAGDPNIQGESPGVVMERYYKLLESREYKKVAQMYSNKGRELSAEELLTVEEKIKKTAEKHKNKDGINDVIVIEEILIGDRKTAFVKYNIVYNNGEEDDLKQAFEKIDGKWHLKTSSTY